MLSRVLDRHFSSGSTGFTGSKPRRRLAGACRNAAYQETGGPQTCAAGGAGPGEAAVRPLAPESRPRPIDLPRPGRPRPARPALLSSKAPPLQAHPAPPPPCEPGLSRLGNFTTHALPVFRSRNRPLQSHGSALRPGRLRRSGLRP